MVSLLGAVLYGVYVVASKPEHPVPPEIAAHEETMATLPVIDRGTASEASESERPALMAPPKLTAKNPLANETVSVPKIPSPPPRLTEEHVKPANDSQVQPASNWEEATSKSPAIALDVPDSSNNKTAANSLRSSVYAPQASATNTTPSVTSPETKQESYSAPRADHRVSGVSYTPNAPSSNDPPAKSTSNEDIAAAQMRVRLYAFHQAWKGAQEQVREGQYREALLTLSAFYDDPAIPSSERQALMEWLDALAARVVYSTEHFLEQPYVVRRGETLYTIAEQYHVPYLLLKNINGVRDPELLLPGTKLKVVPGPFRAEVNLKSQELTLFVGGLYAGRFSCELNTQNVRVREYAVKDKSNRKQYYTASGTLAPNDPRNPYGGIWIDLGNDVCIHGTASDAYQATNAVSISLTPRDADDVYGILSVGSQVVVKP
jgi:LysM repeat protein